MSTSHSKKAAEFLKNPERITRHDQTFWGIRQKRDMQARLLPEWEELREHASQIKEHTLTHLADYLEEFATNLEKKGVVVHWAEDAQEFNEITYGILETNKVKKLVKSKSMLTEECEMNDYLIERGIDVVESDLGERILQLLKQKPSHIVVPAVHLTRDEVGELFEKEGISKEIGNHDPTYLTQCARYSLREEFLEADAGMTGCNFGVASVGDCVVCTNEGNADMTTAVPKLHIVAMGIDKVIPDYDALAVFQRLLCRCGTGQPSTTYTSHIGKARPDGKMHVILVDNGRSDIIANPTHWKTAKCIRCGACMNTCPVYRRSMGYSYSYFIPGPIGVNLGMLRNPKIHSGNVSACSLCLSCDHVCPTKVNPGSQIYNWRQELEHFGTENKEKKYMASAMRRIFGSSSLYNMMTKQAFLVNYIPSMVMNNKLNPWSKGHSMPRFPKKPFHEIYRQAMKELDEEKKKK